MQHYRDDFPILGREVYHRPLVYLDNAATTQKPRCVVEAMTAQYYETNANVHRGVHFLSQRATDLHEGARETVRRFIHGRNRLYPRDDRKPQPRGLLLRRRLSESGR